MGEPIDDGWPNPETAAIAREIRAGMSLHRDLLARINSQVTADAVDEATVDAGREVAATWGGRFDVVSSAHGVDFQELGEPFLLEVLAK
jgi:hypothetical protein